MSMIHMQEDGSEIEVYTADEVKAQTETAVKAKEAEFGGTKTELEKKLEDATKALNERAGEFSNFRKLNEATVAKLTVAERTIYENGLRLKESEDRRVESEKLTREKSIDSIIRTKVGTNEALFTKVKSMYSIIGIEANTAEEIEKKTMAALGALGTTEPDLVAGVINFNGSAIPPRAGASDEKGYGDTDKGKALAKELNLTLEVPKK